MDLLCSVATPCKPSLPAPGCNSLGCQSFGTRKTYWAFMPLGEGNCSANMAWQQEDYITLKVLRHLSTVLYSAKASWKPLEKLPDLQKYLNICLPVKSVSLQHQSPLGSLFTPGCLSQLLLQGALLFASAQHHKTHYMTPEQHCKVCTGM